MPPRLQNHLAKHVCHPSPSRRRGGNCKPLLAATPIHVYYFAEPTTAIAHHQVRFPVAFTQATTDRRWRFVVAPPQILFPLPREICELDRYYLRKLVALKTMLKQRRRVTVHLPILPGVDKHETDGLLALQVKVARIMSKVDGWLGGMMAIREQLDQAFHDDLRSS